MERALEDIDKAVWARVWMRTDGFFVFRLSFLGAKKTSAKDIEQFDTFAIDVAHLAAKQIKRANFDRRSVAINASDSSRSHKQITVKPIKIDLRKRPIDEANLEQQLEDDPFLYELCAKIREKTDRYGPYEEGSLFYTPEDEIPAIILLRRQFGRCYDGALRVRRDFAERPLDLGGGGGSIRFFGVAHISLAWLIYGFFVILYFARDPAVPRIGAATDLWPFFQSIPYITFVAIMMAGVPFLLTYYILVVRTKRDKTISAYDRARGILQLGNYFHAISSKVILASRETQVPPSHMPQNFDLLIDRLNEYRRIETVKRANDMWWIRTLSIPVLIVLGGYFEVPELLSTVLNSEWLEGWKNLIGEVLSFQINPRQGG